MAAAPPTPPCPAARAPRAAFKNPSGKKRPGVKCWPFLNKPMWNGKRGGTRYCKWSWNWEGGQLRPAMTWARSSSVSIMASASGLNVFVAHALSLKKRFFVVSQEKLSSFSNSSRPLRGLSNKNRMSGTYTSVGMVQRWQRVPPRGSSKANSSCVSPRMLILNGKGPFAIPWTKPINTLLLLVSPTPASVPPHPLHTIIETEHAFEQTGHFLMKLNS
mmetsp:Transcript_65154/g.122031  ORF Transcript_65154/g.122031 Transcript_65154/m.122031 type:complete len:217 (-) Transcript_65154:217-867(-)